MLFDGQPTYTYLFFTHSQFLSLANKKHRKAIDLYEGEKKEEKTLSYIHNGIRVHLICIHITNRCLCIKRRQSNNIIVCDDAILPIIFIYPLYNVMLFSKRTKYITDCLDNF